MRAAVLHKTAPVETGPLVLEEVEKPRPGGGQLLLRVLACGVCRSYLHMIEGDWEEKGSPAKLPVIPGHEVVGVVEELGEGVSGDWRNRLVGVQPQYSNCGLCEYCLSGRENLCSSSLWTGDDVDGGLAEYMLSVASHTYKIPAQLDPIEAAPLFCAGITAYRAVRRTKPTPASTLAIIGVGGLGHLAIQFARLYSAKVVAVSRNPRHRELAERLGAEPHHPDEPSLSQTIRADSAIVFAPSDDTVRLAWRLVKRGGRIVVAGYTSSIPTFDFGAEKEVTGTLVGTRREMMEVISLAAKGLVKPQVEHHRLEDINHILLRLKNNEVVGRAVVSP
jgi:propanol-preferring alcohol dehydrogenase